MTYPKWLYYILKKDGRSGKIVNGVPTFTGIPTPLPQTPQGWQEINLAFERGLDKHGLSTQFSLQFGYVLDGSHLLRDAIYNRTTEDELFLLIQRLSLIATLTTYDWYYKYFVKMEIDLSNAEDEQDYFKSPLLGTGLEKLIKANYDTDYSFPMDDPEAVNLEMDGIEIQGVYKWIFPERPTDGDFDVFPYMAVLESNEKAPGIAAFDVPNENEFTGTIDINSTDYCLTATTMSADTTGIFTATINVTSLVSGPIEFLLTIFNTISGDITQIQLMDPQTGPAGTYTMNKEVDLKNGDRYFFTAAESYEEFTLTFTVKSKFITTVIKAFKRSTVLRKLIKQITGSEDFAKSDLCTEFDNLLILPGDSVRGLETAKLKTKLSDFSRDCDCTLMTGEALIKVDGQEKYEIEEREFYYDANNPYDEIDLGEATDFKIVPAKDLKCNTFKVGHQKQNIEDVNGKYDPNGNNLFTGPLSKDVKEYNMVSPYKAGPYEIEFLRQNLDGKTTTDNDSDSDVFVIAAEPGQTEYVDATISFSEAFAGIIMSTSVKLRAGQQIRITGSVSNDGVYDVSGVGFFLLFSVAVLSQPVTDEADVVVTIEILSGFNYILNRPVYDSIEGVPTDTIFNLPFLTPKTMLKRHLKWISSMNYGLTSKIKFSSDKDNKNSELKTVLGSVTVDEDADESFTEIMFKPFYAIFKAAPITNLPELLEDNPNRTFKVTDENGYIWKGFLRISGLAANEYTPNEWRLLLTPDNDMKRRIY